MAHHDVVENNTKQELLFSLLGLALFALLAGGIIVSAYLRPAGEHQPLTEAEPEATLVNAASEGVAPAQAENAGVDNHTDPVLSTTADSPSGAPEALTPATTPPPDAAAIVPAGTADNVGTTAAEAMEADTMATPSSQAQTTN